MNKEIKYIGFYSINNSNTNRYSALSAVNKMDYVCDALNKAGYKVHLISTAWFNGTGKIVKFQWQSKVKIGEFKRLTLCPSFGTKIKILGAVKVGLSLTWLFFWLLFNTKRDEKILVYHSPILAIPILFAQRVKKFKILLEVEEIYCHVYKNSIWVKKLEQNLISRSHSIIAVSDVLAEILGKKVKCIIYGNYSIQINHNRQITSNGRINMVYAGSIERTKNGAFNTVKCAKLLPKDYLIHICGYGSVDSIKELEQQIVQVNNDLSRVACIYHGILPDAEFSAFLQSCQIAINPQKDGENMTTLFPSKIIKYLSHNLRVVSTKITSISKSPFAPLITFSNNDSPEAISNAIMKIDLNQEYDAIPLIKKLDQKVISDLKEIFSE
jgi:hypothetical protein